jgi:hypothetical protein
MAEIAPAQVQFLFFFLLHFDLDLFCISGDEFQNRSVGGSL